MSTRMLGALAGLRHLSGQPHAVQVDAALAIRLGRRRVAAARVVGELDAAQHDGPARRLHLGDPIVIADDDEVVSVLAIPGQHILHQRPAVARMAGVHVSRALEPSDRAAAAARARGAVAGRRQAAGQRGAVEQRPRALERSASPALGRAAALATAGGDRNDERGRTRRLHRFLEPR
jgi:hypothetical protein